jgi:hypothetical protein
LSNRGEAQHGAALEHCVAHDVLGEDGNQGNRAAWINHVSDADDRVKVEA